MGIALNPLSGQLQLLNSPSMSIGGTVAGSTPFSLLSISGINTLAQRGPLTDGQLLIGSTGNAAVATTLTGTSNQLTVTNATGSITLSLPQDIAITSSPQFANLILTPSGSLDITAAGGTLAIGTTNADIINIGNTGATVNVQGTTFYQNVTDLVVTDKRITLNSGGSAGSASNSGIELEENAIITAYLDTSADRNSWELKAPATAGVVLVTPGVAGFTIDQGSHNPVTLGTANGLSLSTQALSLALASTSTTGALSDTDWDTFNNKQDLITATTSADYYRGDKTFQTLNTSVVPESGSLYFTNPRSISSTLTGYTSGAGTVSASDTIIQAIQKLNGNDNTVSVANAVAHSTGIITGGVLSIGSPTTTFSITDGTGMVVDNTVTPATVTQVSWTGKTNIIATYVSSGLVSYVAIDSTGAVVQQLAPFSNAQHRQYIVLGSLIHVNLTNLDVVNQFGEIAISPNNQLSDLYEALGKFNISGNVFSANGANLNINKSVGTVHSQGANWGISTSDPNVVSLASLTAATFQYRFQNGTNGTTGISINPNIYDSSGVSTTVPTNKVTIQRIYSFVSNNVKIQPGQFLYNSIAEAKAAIQTETFITEQSIKDNGILRGFLVIKQGTTNLQNVTDAFFYEAGKFSGQTGVGGQSVSSLQNAYNNSLTPEILTDSTRVAVTIKRGSAADTDSILEGQNGSGSTTFSVNGNGLATVSNLTIDVFTGLLKAASGVVSVATSGTDYAPGVTADITPTTWAGLANNTANQTITGLTFATTVSSFETLMNIYIDATTDLFTSVKITGTRKSLTDWTGADIQWSFTGDAIVGLDFTITAAGQVRVTTGSISGFVSGSVKFRAITLS